MFVDVTFPISSYKTFVYKIPKSFRDGIDIGIRVKVPFRNSEAQGYITEIKTTTKYQGKIKPVLQILDKKPVFSKNLWELVLWMSNYYLTPKGFSEKARLTGEYLKQGFQLFRLSRSQIAEIMKICESQGFKRLVLVGATDITEIAILCAQEFDLDVIGVLVEKAQDIRFGNVVVTDLSLIHI